MKIQYKCEVCSHVKDTEEQARTCENTHTIIKPKLFWLIPGVGYYMFFYSLITKKNAIIRSGNDFKDELFSSWIAISPILLLAVVLLLCSL